MEDVYASAYCTIAATSAVDLNAGFLERNVSVFMFKTPPAGDSMSAPALMISITTWRRLGLTREPGYCKKEFCHDELSILAPIRHILNVEPGFTVKPLLD